MIVYNKVKSNLFGLGAISHARAAAAKLYATIDRIPEIDSASTEGLKQNQVSSSVSFIIQGFKPHLKGHASTSDVLTGSLTPANVTMSTSMSSLTLKLTMKDI